MTLRRVLLGATMLLSGCDGDLESTETSPKPPPVAHDDHITVPEDDPGKVGQTRLLMNDENASYSTSSNPTFKIVTAPQHGTLGTGHGYLPVPGYFGPDSFTYPLTSSAGTSTATVTVEVRRDGVPYQWVQRLDGGAAFGVVHGDFDLDGKIDIVTVERDTSVIISLIYLDIF